MASSDSSSARFRSATEFPKSIADLERDNANQLYEEMRDCLIFTNRSRSQLIRRNEEHKNSALKLKADVERLQSLIQQLTQEKQQLVVNNQSVIQELEQELTSMATYLDRLSEAFEPVAEVETMQQAHWSFLALPNRFFSFLRTVKAIVLWWKEERSEEPNSLSLKGSEPQVSTTADEDDRRENPQMYSDPASQGRSLLDR